jgi:probable HAF family extracellular repeat protein
MFVTRTRSNSGFLPYVSSESCSCSSLSGRTRSFADATTVRWSLVSPRTSTSYGAPSVGRRRAGWRTWEIWARSGRADVMSAAFAISANGSVIVGKALQNYMSSSERAFRWTTRRQMEDLKQALLNAGVTATRTGP